ncbi:acylpyruvase FAHD1, mitochondrial isoform X1 [Lucilia sericata]|uniref:acylpyruvase FAHD1, mitochondrial isoform X1 n=2 Tax=Lucilia sericata TaxID=13632 RepID=UPI0018A84607|nr:acylpyruvase FAHD1, mitochondrial isoform X1 [Lucilia sericata]
MFLTRLLNNITKRTMATASNTELESFVKNSKKIVGAALNYMDIVRERNVPVPELPLMFLKPTTSLVQEGQDIVIPKVFTKVAYEVELGVIIGKHCKNVSKAEALNYVGGYCLALDMTAQCALGEARAKGHPWSLGKGFDTSTPVSRFIKLEDIKDPHNVDLWLKLNGEYKQKGNTSDLIFKVDDLISYTSQFMTLEPNDIILTGTPNGSLPIKGGDVIECGMGDMIKMTFNCKDE